MQTQYGSLLLFGSGETSSIGKKIHRNFFRSLSKKQRIAILETPAGFQPNTALVAKEIAAVFQKTCQQYIDAINIIPARKKDTPFSPDNETLLTPLYSSDYIFLGPGSPTYTVSQLQYSKAINVIRERWQQGAHLVLSSAAALASGDYTLPVYEIYKSGANLYWEKGLSLLKEVGLSLTIVTHWNNTEGGKNLDTRFCYMGEDRFFLLQQLLPKDHILLGIDEHTAIIFDFQQQTIRIEGKGKATLIHNTEIFLDSSHLYDLQAFKKGEKKIVGITKQKAIIHPKKMQAKRAVPFSDLPKDLLALLEKRDRAKKERDYSMSDTIRKAFMKRGYVIEDMQGKQIIHQK